MRTDLSVGHTIVIVKVAVAHAVQKTLAGSSGVTIIVGDIFAPKLNGFSSHRCSFWLYIFFIVRYFIVFCYKVSLF
jgi:hypothetical protein